MDPLFVLLVADRGDVTDIPKGGVFMIFTVLAGIFAAALCTEQFYVVFLN